MEIEVELNEFVGYENTESKSKIYQVETYDDKFIIFTEENPFYFEAGGQISDKGVITIDDTSIEVIDVFQASNGATGLC